MGPSDSTTGTEGDAAAMATRFTRVTVVADGRELDVSLPAARPISEVLPQLCSLLSVAPPGAWGSWSLSNVSGVIDPRGSLDDAGVVDADVLYLTMPDETPAPPFVEDVAEEIRTKLDADGSEWSGRARRLGASAVASAAVIGLVPVMLALPLVPIGRLVALAGVGLGTTFAARLVRGQGGAFLLGAALPAWVLAGGVALPDRLVEAPMFLVAGAAGVGLGLVAFAVLDAAWRPAVAAGVVLLALGGLATGLGFLGLRPALTAALVVVPALFVLGLAPQLALGRSGLLRMMRADEQGRHVLRDEVDRAVVTGQGVLTGVVCGTAAVLAVVAGVLLMSREPAAVSLGAVLCLLLGLRSRAFTRTAQVVPLLGGAVVAATVGIVAIPRWLVASDLAAGWVSLVGLVGLGVLVLTAAANDLDEVSAARLRRGLDLLEAVAMVAVVPLILAVVGAFDWARALAS
jgi:type VII secretion integral membrane protein EccD